MTPRVEAQIPLMPFLCADPDGNQVTGMVFLHRLVVQRYIRLTPREHQVFRLSPRIGTQNLFENRLGFGVNTAILDRPVLVPFSPTPRSQDVLTSRKPEWTDCRCRPIISPRRMPVVAAIMLIALKRTSFHSSEKKLRASSGVRTPRSSFAPATVSMSGTFWRYFFLWAY